MNHEHLVLITHALPMRTIEVRGEPYLERYFLSEAPDGTQLWLHRFLRNDSERHLHTHPWSAQSFLLCGWYEEELEGGERQLRNLADGAPLDITPGRLHRVAAVEPNTWTLMVVSPERLPHWHFVDEGGVCQFVETSPRHWFKDCTPRGCLR